MTALEACYSTHLERVALEQGLVLSRVYTGPRRFQADDTTPSSPTS
ncbi:hypothetical protein [Natronorubrum thiooxidans]|nr:hypothetical protein [Natronorubrum thiooxidans]